jgi:hypothetical protein
MNALTRRALTLVATLSLAGCASGRPGASYAGAVGTPARVEIHNRNFSDATVWAVYPAERLRLGTVTGMTESSFTLSRSTIPQPVYMEIDLVGGPRCVSETLTVDQGDVLYLEIQPDTWFRRECR